VTPRRERATVSYESPPAGELWGYRTMATQKPAAAKKPSVPKQPAAASSGP